MLNLCMCASDLGWKPGPKLTAFGKSNYKISWSRGILFCHLLSRTGCTRGMREVYVTQWRVSLSDLCNQRYNQVGLQEGIVPCDSGLWKAYHTISYFHVRDHPCNPSQIFYGIIWWQPSEKIWQKSQPVVLFCFFRFCFLSGNLENWKLLITLFGNLLF